MVVWGVYNRRKKKKNASGTQAADTPVGLSKKNFFLKMNVSVFLCMANHECGFFFENLVVLVLTPEDELH